MRELFRYFNQTYLIAPMLVELLTCLLFLLIPRLVVGKLCRVESHHVEHVPAGLFPRFRERQAVPMSSK